MVSGEALRRILKEGVSIRRRTGGLRCAAAAAAAGGGGAGDARCGVPSTTTEVRRQNSREEVDDEEEEEEEEYLKCFVVSTRGKLQTEKWIKHSDVRKTEDDDASADETKTKMLVATKDIVFRMTDPESLPGAIRRPPVHCRQVYVLDEHSSYRAAAAASEDRQQSNARKTKTAAQRKENSSRKWPKEEVASASSSSATESIFLRSSNPVPPPLPPKPEYLPNLASIYGFNSRQQSRTTEPDDDPPKVLPSSGSLLPIRSSPAAPPPSPSPLPVTKSRSVDDESELHFSAKTFTPCEEEECRVSGTGSSESEAKQTMTETVDAAGVDHLSLNFAVEVEESVDDQDDAVGCQDNGVTPHSPKEPGEKDSRCRTTTEERRVTAADTETASCGRDSASVISSDPRLRQPDAVMTETTTQEEEEEEEEEDSNTGHTGRLNARDSGVDSVVSQCFQEEEEEESVAGPGFDLDALKIPASEEGDGDSASTDFSYYEDIELLLGPSSSSHSFPSASSASSVPPSHSIYLDPNSGRSTFSSEHDQRVIPCGSLLLVETEEVLPSRGGRGRGRGGGGETVVPETEEEEQLVSFRGTVLGYDKEGCAYYLPGDSVKRYGDPEHEDWFYPIPLTPHEASIFLHRENQTGCFVVYRPRTNSSARPPVRFLLSVCCGGGGGRGGGGGGEVVHYSIVENVRGDFQVEGHDHSFMTLCDLVTYFRRNQSHLATRLRRCLKDARTPIQPGIQYPERMEIAKSQIQLEGKISGSRTAKEVTCHGRLNGSKVTVKVLTAKTEVTAADEDDFLEEAQTLMTLRHDSVVRLLGLSCRSRPFYIVSECFERGSLLDCLHSGLIRPESSVDAVFDVCLQTAAAGAYLEARRFVLHRAMAARSFFVTHDLVVKLGSFDRARSVVDDSYVACPSEAVSVRWAAPEVLLESSYSTKSDVWAVGVVWWEAFSAGARPYGQLTDEEAALYVAGGGRLERPGTCTNDLFLLMKSCWRHLASERPSFAAIQERIKGNSSGGVYYCSAAAASPPSAAAAAAAGLRAASDVPRLPVKTKASSNATKQSAAAKFRHPSTRSAEGVAAEGGARHCGSGAQLKVPGSAVAEGGRTKVCSSGGERVQSSSSSSSSSVVSASASNDFDQNNKEDLSRGDKIRKSIRKLIIGKKTAK